jgi:hypothetical protein
VVTWADVKARWSQGWQALSQAASDTWSRAIHDDPGAFTGHVAAFQDQLSQTRATLDRMRNLVPNPPVTADDQAAASQLAAFESRYHELAAGLYADAQPAAQPAVGFLPLLVVGGLALGAAAIAWSVSAYQYAVNLREQTALAERELTARIEASQAGRVLQPSTLPAPPPPPSPTESSGLGLWLLGGLGLVAAAVTLPVLLQRK